MNRFRCHLSFVCLLVGAGFAFAQPYGLTQRVPNTTLALPPYPPVFGYALTNAFGAITFSSPLCIRTPPNETDRVFVLEKAGRIQVVTNIGAANPTKSLYMSLTYALSTSSEQGLLGLAFHPNFQSNGYFYIYRTILVTNGPTIVTNERLARFQASPPSAATAFTNTETVLFDQQDLAGNHNGGDLHFGPDGYLYLSLGDGGMQNDALNNTQTIRKGFQSGILRLDVDQLPGSLTPNPSSSISMLTIYPNTYAVPPDNPWVTTDFIYETNRSATFSGNVRSEFWAVGLRNPWRFSFDPVTGWLWEGDVGGGAREEVNIITKGGDYGWGYREGFTTGPKSGQTNSWYNGSTPSPWATSFVGLNPVWDYQHTNSGGSLTNLGDSITGGLVYRGDNISQLTGAYVFCDYVSGNLWSLRYDGTNVTDYQRLLQDTGIVAFGTDPRNADLLLADYSGAQVRRLIYDTNFTGTPLPATLADTGAFGNLTSLTLNAGIVPYTINVPFWSDSAIKMRWFSVPNTNLVINWSPSNNWSFPTGTVWIKHFDLVTNYLTGASKRVETRFLVRNSDGVYGLTYRWGNSAANAALTPEGGTNDVFVITDPGGVLRTQLWFYPSRNDCQTCHTPVAGFALGFNTPQVNCNETYTNFPGATGLTDNQLRALSHVGYFSPPVTNLYALRALAPAADTSSSLEYRVRSYLAANCVQCHQPGGTGLGLWDARITTPTSQAGLINGGLVDDQGDPNNRIIKPGLLTNSILYRRIAVLGTGHMPPLATSLLDTNDINLLVLWINSGALASYQTFAEWQVTWFGSTGAPNAAPDADPDGDGLSNYLEYLLGKNPSQATSDWKVDIQMAGGSAQILFPHLANRGFEVQSRSNLSPASVWQVLDVPGNQPFFSAADFPGVVEDPVGGNTNKFYRVRVFEP